MEGEVLQHKLNCRGLEKHYEMLCHLVSHSPPSLPVTDKITLLHIPISYLLTWMRTLFFLNNRSYFSPYLVVQ